MEKTPISLRKHVAIFGNTNVGKSTMFNALLGQDISIVSDVSGTTTDPVTKAMELIGYGPVALVDTAGLGDESVLGEKRESKTKDILSRTDLVIYVRDISRYYEPLMEFDLPAITVYTKCDVADKKFVEEIKKENKNDIFIGDYSDEELNALKKRMIAELKKQESDDETLLGNILLPDSTVVMVVPIDDAAPKGRLILPQVQAIRDCLDNGMKAVVVKPEALSETISEIKKVDLVVTDSQAFKEVSDILPENIPLTSFSMLLANQKGDISQFIDGTKVIPFLNDGDEILFLEACTHSASHEDIGRVKIPALLTKKTGKKLTFTYMTGYDFPRDVERYKLVIHCGGCMINKREIKSRLTVLREKNVPVTNYGVILAYLNGILKRASQIFNFIKTQL